MALTATNMIVSATLLFLRGLCQEYQSLLLGNFTASPYAV